MINSRLNLPKDLFFKKRLVKFFWILINQRWSWGMSNWFHNCRPVIKTDGHLMRFPLYICHQSLFSFPLFLALSNYKASYTFEYIFYIPLIHQIYDYFARYWSTSSMLNLPAPHCFSDVNIKERRAYINSWCSWLTSTWQKGILNRQTWWANLNFTVSTSAWTNILVVTNAGNENSIFSTYTIKIWEQKIISINYISWEIKDF